MGDEVSIVQQKEDKEGRLILSRSAPSTARLGLIEKIKESDGVVTGTVIRWSRAA